MQGPKNVEKQNSGIDPLLLRLTWEFACKEEFGFICAHKLIAKLKEERDRNMIIVKDINNSLSNWIDYLNKKINEETMKL